jgi:hypothetical protein
VHGSQAAHVPESYKRYLAIDDCGWCFRTGPSGTPRLSRRPCRRWPTSNLSAAAAGTCRMHRGRGWGCS